MPSSLILSTVRPLRFFMESVSTNEDWLTEQTYPCQIPGQTKADNDENEGGDDSSDQKSRPNSGRMDEARHEEDEDT